MCDVPCSNTNRQIQIQNKRLKTDDAVDKEAIRKGTKAHKKEEETEEEGVKR
jgi:hypothetical protein